MQPSSVRLMLKVRSPMRATLRSRHYSDVSPDEYIASLEEPRHGDVEAIDDLIQRVAPQLDRRMERGMIVYGSYHYRYASGREGDWFPIALASNKRYISLYVMA